MDFELTAEQQTLRQRARDLADRTFAERAARWDASEQYPWDNVKDLVTAGFMGMAVPTAYGGGGRPLLDVILVIEEIARACGITGRIVVEGNLGTVGALNAYGTDAQKRRWFPWVLEGEKPAIAISEPAAGSGVFVERDTPGFRIGRREFMMGLRGIPEGELHFESCEVPRENLLVGPGDGFKKLMAAYNGQRLGAATVALGLAQGAYENALAYASIRKQFGRPIGDFQGIRWKLADMAIKIDAARLLIHRAAARAGHRFPDALEAAKAKTFAAETAQQVTSEALQIHGAAGYGRTLPLERMMRDARMFAIGGGTLEMMRNLVADRITGSHADWRRH